LERVTVTVPERAYEVCIGSGVLARADELLPALPGAERAFVIADAPVAERYLPALADGLAAAGSASCTSACPRARKPSRCR
jgi:3-dehydroquinate synthetase